VIRFKAALISAPVCCVVVISALAVARSAAARADEPARGFHWVDRPEQGTADLLDDGKPVLRYMYAFDRSTPKRAEETFKVYHHVFGPGTEDLITNGPSGLYPHHRGLFVGWRRTQYEGGEIDSWHCIKGAHQRHIRFVEKGGNAHSGFMTSEIAWNDGKGKPVIDELRTVRVTNVGRAGGPPAWQIDWSTRLESRRGKIELNGDRQHAGFQFRAAQSVAQTNSATYLRPKGFPQQPKAFEVDDRKDPDKYVNLGWLAMSYEINGKPYTVTYFEDPALPKPSKFSERPYGRFGAYFKTTLTPERPLTMRYRLIVSTDSSPNRDAIQAEYDRFVAEMARQPIAARP
jgi:Methane oxygenase PmoA